MTTLPSPFTTDYAQLLQQHLASQTFNVVRYELPGESVWLKKAGPPIAAT